ncbi:aminoglycoside 6'-N-acetyltransferase [Devosia sp.]|uniref:aminoglycoside 6'-N-acetyltransferase n=1 Tax=Devosia sp. TaxID=1871048 RepID=UPI003A94EA1E
MTRVVLATEADVPDWRAMRDALWPDSVDDNPGEIAAQLDNPEAIALLARDESGNAVGFAEGALRHDYVNGCDTSPVGYLEGIYVVPEARRTGVARALIAAIATWARDQGCRELASDAALDNIGSQQMHEALGFSETERTIFYRQAL